MIETADAPEKFWGEIASLRCKVFPRLQDPGGGTRMHYLTMLDSMSKGVQ
jgi:hypothetical protein